MSKEAKREAIKEVKKEKRVKDKKLSRFKITQVLTKNKLALATVILMLIAIVGATVLTYNKASVSQTLDAELLRARTYEQFTDGDENVDGTDNVKFSAFFLRDIDGDGYAEKLKGTCKKIGQQDTVYMEIVVQTEGYLKDGKIQIDGKNIYLQTKLPKDSDIKRNCIGDNIKTIEFNNLQNGTQKLLTGVIRSGDYTYTSSKTSAIGNNINNYSRSDNKIILTGTYVAEDGTETEIIKEVKFETDWYGTTSAVIYAGAQNYYDITNRIDTENGVFRATFSVCTDETIKHLNLFSNHTEGIIPQLNNYNPISVTLESGSGDFKYDDESRKFTIDRISEVDENGNIVKSVAAYLENKIQVEYPLEAYEAGESEIVTLKIPVSTYYNGYNNPHVEFNNPYVSNNAALTLTLNYMLPKEEEMSFDITVGKYASGYYMISKRKPLRIYNGISSEENDDTYLVTWRVNTGTQGETTGLCFKETKNDEAQKVDTFIKSDTTEDSMEDKTSNIGIYFSNATELLGEYGEIKVYDEDTGELLHTFTKSDWEKYTASNPYRYEIPVKHIRVETSATKALEVFYVNNVKELNDDNIVETYTKEEFKDIKFINSNLVMYLDGEYRGAKTGRAKYEEPYSISRISLEKNILSTQSTEEGMNIFVETVAYSNSNQEKWVSGNFLIKFPEEILNIIINSVTINNTSVTIDSYELIEIENCKFIKIKTSNTNPEIYTISINADITPDPRIPSTSKNVKLYAMNDYCDDYNNSSEDIYDIDNDENIEELVNLSSTGLSMIAPNSLLTNQTMSEYDEKGTLTISPQIVDLKPIYGDDDREKETVKIGVQIRNNYSRTISEAVVLGKIPFEGNTYVLSQGDLKSEFNTCMKNTGIIVPEELENKVIIYYSTKENPSKNLNDANNEWTLTEDVENWNDIKTWMIDFKDTVIQPGIEHIFYYTVEIPYGTEFNKVSYSHHAVYFCLDTPEGKYRTQTEPNRIGVRIADKYNLVLTKYLKDQNSLIKGATYRISKLDDDGNIEESNTAITNNNGLLEMANLYVEKTYEIKEIQTPVDYELNEDVIKIVAHINRENGLLTIEKMEGTTRGEPQVEKNESEDYKVLVNVEDEAKIKLNLTKTDKETATPIKGVRFGIKGEGFPQNGKKVITNEKGEITLKGLKVGEEYTIEELKAEGYYLVNPIIFKVENSNGDYEIQILEGELKSYSILTENDLPIASLEIENERIPKYDLVINKIAKGTGVGEIPATPIEGAKFKLYKNNRELGEYITDSEGHIKIEGLYQYVEEKDFEATYVLREVLAPEGYAKVGNIIFKVQEVENELTLVSEQTNNFTVNNGEITLTIEDSPSFKLIKKDGETNTLLPNVKFAIYDVTNGEVPARNSKGEIIGTKEFITGKEYYTVTTNSNGEIIEDLPEGLYKAVEVEAPIQYDSEGQEKYFGIGAGREEKTILDYDVIKLIQGDNSSVKIKSMTKTQDGGYAILGTFEKTFSIDRYDFNNNGGSDGMIIKINNEGRIQWTKVIGGEKTDTFEEIIETLYGEIVIGGYFDSETIQIENQTIYNNSTNTDGIIVKYSKDGEFIWTEKIGGIREDRVMSLSPTVDGGFFASGHYNDVVHIGNTTLTAVNQGDGIYMKYSRNCEVEWVRNVGRYSDADVEKIVSTNDNGCVLYIPSANTGISRQSEFYGSNFTGGLAKIDENGNLEWIKKVGWTKSDSIKEASDGSIVFVIRPKYSNSSNMNLTIDDNRLEGQGFIIKLDKDGNYKWGYGLNVDNGKNLALDIDDEDRILLSGYASSEITIKNDIVHSNTAFLMQISIDGNIEFAKSIGRYMPIYLEQIDEETCIIGGNFNGAFQNSRESIYISDYIYSGLITKAFIKQGTELVMDHSQILQNISSIYTSSIIETSDNDIVLGGFFENTDVIIDDNTILENAGSRDGLIIKCSMDGEIRWAKSIGGTGYDYINSIIELNNGGYIAIGTCGEIAFDGNKISGGIIIKYSSEGELEWINSIDGYLKSVTPTRDGGFIIGGHYSGRSLNLGNNIILTNNGSYDCLIIKYSSNGEIEWANSFGGNGSDTIASIIETQSGDIIVGGSFLSREIVFNNIRIVSKGYHSAYNSIDASGYIAKYSSNGEIKDAQCIAESSYTNEINSITEANDGSIILVGSARMNSETVGYIWKYDNDSIVKVINYIDNDWSVELNSIRTTSDDGFIVSGTTYSSKTQIGSYYAINNGTRDLLIVKYNSNMEVQGVTNVGGSNNDTVIDTIETNDGKILTLGKFESATIKVGKDSIYNTNRNNTSLLRIYQTQGVSEQSEVEILNNIKKFSITTDVNEIDEIKGGRISGEDQKQYEEVKYGETSTKEIKMIPDENYEIINVTVNGEEYPFEKDIDGSYTMPQFENVTENKHVEVTYSLKDNKITINKIDSVSREKLSNITFKLDQIEERIPPVNSNIIGPLTDNGATYYEADLENDVTSEVLGTLTSSSNNTYNFIEQDGKYYPTNSKTYQIANGGSGGIQGYTAYSYIPIDLRELTGKYVVVVNASISCENSDYGFVNIGTSTSTSSYYNNSPIIYQLYGIRESKDYYNPSGIEGGSIYYLHMGYYKNGSVDTEDDQIVINSVKVYKAKEIVYNFEMNNGKYEAISNKEVESSIANSYLPLDLTNYPGKYIVTVNAEILTVSGDYGYATVTSSTEIPDPSNLQGRAVYITGTQEAKDYTVEVDGGMMQYLHLGYKKDANINYNGNDTFIVNSIDISLSNSELYHTRIITNSEGQGVTQIPFGKYQLTEQNTPEGYWPIDDPIEIEFRSYDGAQHEFTIENEKKARVVVHHYIKDTTTKLADDEELFGRVGEKYTTLPNIDISNYELETDEQGEMVLPLNNIGEYKYVDQEVTYYYVKSKVSLVVHHYIEDSTTPVLLKDGTQAEDINSFGNENDRYETEPIDSSLLSDEYELMEMPYNSEGIYQYPNVEVIYYYRPISRTLVINKTSENGEIHIPNVSFAIKKDGENNLINNGQTYTEIDYNYDESSEIGNMVDNGKEYVIAIPEEEMQELSGNLTNNGTYYFVSENGKYYPTNSKAWQMANVEDATGGIRNSTANSYMQIDLSDYSGDYAIVINSSISSESNCDIGYATITQTTNAPTHTTKTGQFMYISGTVSDNNYVSSVLKGGNIYYLHFGYRKDSSIDNNDDQVVINSIKLYSARAESTSYSFDNNEGILTSNNIGKDNTVANAYFPIDLSRKAGKYYVVVNAQVSSQYNYDYGYATVTTTTTRPAYSDTTGRFVCISSTQEAKDYKMILEGGKKYYLHIGYHKNDSTSDGSDVFTINSIKLYRSKNVAYGFIEENGTYKSNNAGKLGTVAAAYIPIDLIDARGEFELKVNAKLEGQSGSYGYGIISESQVRPSYNSSDGRFIYASSSQSDKDYLTTLEGGKIYYLHFGYYRSSNTYTGLDTFTINSIKINDKDYAKIIATTDENGKITKNLRVGTYSISEIATVDGYVLKEEPDIVLISREDDIKELNITNERKKGTVTVHHYLVGTTENVPSKDGGIVEDEIKTDAIGEKYATKGSPDASKRYRVASTSGDTSGEYIDGNIDVIYYYELNEQKYKVEYYYENVLDENKTDEFDAICGDEILSYTEKNVKGYKLDFVDKIPFVVTENAGTNIIKVYYDADPDQTKELKYTVEYYISRDIQNEDTEEVTNTVQVLEPNTLEVQKDDINTEDKYTGYKLEKILINDSEEPVEELPDTVNDNDVIKVFYVLDDDQTKEIKYTVEYYKDGELQEDDTQVVRKVVQVLDGDTLEVNVEEINTDDKYEGYTFEKTNPARIPSIAVDGEVIKVYYVKTKYPYTVEYYYNNVKDSTLTETGEAHKDDIIEEYTNKPKEGYEFEEVGGIPLTISDTEPNVIKVYYLPIRNITIEHIDKNTGEVIETEEKHGKEGYTVTTSAKDIDDYMLVESPETEEYTYTEEDQTVKYYYAKVSSGVLEKHLDLITGKPIAEDVFYEGYEGKSYTTSTKKIEGYKVSTNKELYESIVKENPEFLSEAGYESLVDFFEETGIAVTEEYIPVDAEGEMTEELIEVRYYYTPKVKLVVKYLDILTGEIIEENVEGELVDSTINREGEINEAYTTVAKTFENYLGISNKAYYRTYLTNHPEVLEEAGVETVEEYLEKENIDPKAPYVPENNEGTFEIKLNEDGTYSNEITVTYYYGPEREVTIKYYDKNTGEEISEETVKVGPDGDTYDLTDTEKEIEGYTLVEEPENPNGIYQEENEERKFYYAKNTQVKVQYVDKDTKGIIDTRANYTIDGYVGKAYETDKKTFDNYNFVSNTKNAKGEMTEDTIEVIYYYSKAQVPTPQPNPTPTPKPTPQPSNNKTPSTTQKRSVVQRIVNPKTGDMVPVVAYSTIFVVLAINIMLVKYNRRELVRVSRRSKTARNNRVSRISQTCSREGKTKTGRHEIKKEWVEAQKGKRTK